MIFNGGFGDKYATQVHEPLYKAGVPQGDIKHESVTEINKTLQPRFSGGTDVPDVVDNSGSGLMDFGALVADKQLADLTPMWDAPSVDDANKKVKDTVVPGTVDVGAFNGTPYVMYYVSTVFGLWYSGKLFADKGWTAPTTWADFTKLCDQIKAAGITPFGYAGANAAYYMWKSFSPRRQDRRPGRTEEHRQPGAGRVDRAGRQAGRRRLGRDRRQVHRQGVPGPAAHRRPARAEPVQGRVLPQRRLAAERAEGATPSDFKYQMLPNPT